MFFRAPIRTMGTQTNNKILEILKGKSLFVARWVDEDTGAHELHFLAESKQDAEERVVPLANNNSVAVHGPLQVN